MILTKLRIDNLKCFTFADPADQTALIFCPFHGKIKTPQYRIHFPWPLAREESRLRIAYIGPKLTKD